MADNTTLNAGAGGDTIATDDIGGVKYQWVKQGFGADGAFVAVENAPDAALPVQMGIGKSVTGPLNALAATLTIELNGAPTVLMNFVNTSYSGTLLSEGSIDGGVTFNTCLTWSIGAVANSGGSQVPTNANLTMANVSGMTHFRVRVSVYTSGTLVGTIRSGTTPIAMSILNGAIGSISTITGSVVPGVAATNLGKAEDAIHTSGDTGVAVWGVRNEAGTVFTSATGDYSPIAVDSVGNVGMTVIPKTSVAAAPTKFRVVSLNSTNATSQKVGNANLYQIIVTNTNAAVRFVKFYDKASVPTVGTDVPTMTLGFATGTTPINLEKMPESFTLGLAFAMTTGAADSDAGVVAAGDLILHLRYA